MYQGRGESFARSFSHRTFVREFYANLRFKVNAQTRSSNKNILTSRVNKMDIEFNVDNLCTIFNLSPASEGLSITNQNSVAFHDSDFNQLEALNALSEVPIMDSKHAKAVFLHLPNRLIQRIIQLNIAPKSGSKEAMPFMDTYLTWAVAMNRKVNWANFLFYNLVAGGKRKDSNLLYGRALSRLFESYGVDMSNTEVIPVSQTNDYYNEHLITIMRYHLTNNEWVRNHPLTASIPAPEEEGEEEEEQGHETDEQTNEPSNRDIMIEIKTWQSSTDRKLNKILRRLHRLEMERANENPDYELPVSSDDE